MTVVPGDAASRAIAQISTGPARSAVARTIVSLMSERGTQLRGTQLRGTQFTVMLGVMNPAADFIEIGQAAASQDSLALIALGDRRD